MRIFKNKQNKEEVVVESTKDLEAPVVTEENITKTVCRVLVATPSYFVIDKNGEKITVNKKNDYHRNEEILY